MHIWLHQLSAIITIAEPYEAWCLTTKAAPNWYTLSWWFSMSETVGLHFSIVIKFNKVIILSDADVVKTFFFFILDICHDSVCMVFSEWDGVLWFTNFSVLKSTHSNHGNYDSCSLNRPFSNYVQTSDNLFICTSGYINGMQL